MGDLSASDSSWKKMVIAKTNNKWISKIKSDSNASEDPEDLTMTESYSPHREIKQEIEDSDQQIYSDNMESDEQAASLNNSLLMEMPNHILERSSLDTTLDTAIETPLKRKRRKALFSNETPAERSVRLAKMSAYAARRLANESPEQRALRLKRMSEYAAKRLSQESAEQRARRLARMSAYAAQRLANETPEQRSARLSRMSAYAARRQAMRKSDSSDASSEADLSNMMTFIPNQS